MLTAVDQCFCQIFRWSEGLEENDFSTWQQLVTARFFVHILRCLGWKSSLVAYV